MLEWLAGVLLADPPEHAARPRARTAHRAVRAEAARTHAGAFAPGFDGTGAIVARRADAGRADARQADARQADARQADARQADARQADPGRADPRRADPGQADPGRADPRRAPGQWRLLMGRFCRRSGRIPACYQDLVRLRRSHRTDCLLTCHRHQSAPPATPPPRPGRGPIASQRPNRPTCDIQATPEPRLQHLSRLCAISAPGSCTNAKFALRKVVIRTSDPPRTRASACSDARGTPLPGAPVISGAPGHRVPGSRAGARSRQGGRKPGRAAGSRAGRPEAGQGGRKPGRAAGVRACRAALAGARRQSITPR